MMSQKTPLIIGIFLFGAILISGCIEDSSNNKDEFIVVEFSANTTMQEANRTIIENNCSIERIYVDYLDGDLTYWVEVPHGEEDDYVNFFNDEPNVKDSFRLQIK